MESNLKANNDNLKNQFFSNDSVHYALKAGLAIVALHGTANYPTDTMGKTIFMGTLYKKDLNDNKRYIDGAVSFTFGAPESMGVANCMATMRKISEHYPALADVFEHIADGQIEKSDKEIFDIIVEASAKRFEFNQEGTLQNWERYVADNMKKYLDVVKQFYPGMVSVNVYDDLMNTCKSAFEKKNSAPVATANLTAMN